MAIASTEPSSDTLEACMAACTSVDPEVGITQGKGLYSTKAVQGFSGRGRRLQEKYSRNKNAHKNYAPKVMHQKTIFGSDEQKTVIRERFSPRNLS